MCNIKQAKWIASFPGSAYAASCHWNFPVDPSSSPRHKWSQEWKIPLKEIYLFDSQTGGEVNAKPQENMVGKNGPAITNHSDLQGTKLPD